MLHCDALLPNLANASGGVTTSAKPTTPAQGTTRQPTVQQHAIKLCVAPRP